MVSYERHPLSADYQDISGQRWKLFVDYLKKHGVKDRKIVLHEGKILDGWQLYRACIECSITPEFVGFHELKTGMTPEEYVEMVNDCRRDQEGMDVQMARAEKRRRRVLEARAAGATFEEIAEQEGISKTQAKRDVTPKKSDGPKNPLCDRCKRVGSAVKNCQMCKELRAKSKPKSTGGGGGGTTASSKKKKGDEPTEKVDAFGTVVPRRCLDALFDPWIQEAIDFLGVLSANFWKERLADGLNKRKKHYPFFNAKDFADGVGMIGNTIDQILEHLKEFRPAGVCPACDGKGCPECRMTGLVHRDLHKKLKGKR